MPNGSEKDFLRGTDWLKMAPTSFQDAVLARGNFTTLPAGKVLYDVGDPPGPMMCVVSGHAAVSTATGEGIPRLSHILRPGDWFGVAAILVREPRRVRVVAQVSLQMFILPLREIDAVINDSSNRNDAWRCFARLILMNQDVAVGVARDLMVRDSKVRCFAVLLRLGGYRSGRGMLEEQPEVDLAQEELARLANLSRNAVGTVLHELERANVIEIAYKRLKIIKPAVLIERVKAYERDHS
ncbi:Crp/Fnr family transcriptional regulator [Mesorhizobium sp. LHD-90]|uniref:Crp/Fnr family transcriptional regulator n=1 Tax=Mesorhizobium sp. LHD-90 TaxID=3071414 RepID=UPI0027E00C50|nr:Crp/Fnr family transcriptional regulator [Mesorhizobium sp. LHD-90]MDQ6438160.1 Crp/Fnr family transcriptional regulator [Mesorhizobium sp. LHD-90]